MLFIRNRVLLKILVAVLVALILVACQGSQTITESSLDTAKYVVSFGKQFDNGALLMTIGQKGEVSGVLPYDGYHIGIITEHDGNIFLNSERLNEHYMLDSHGKLTGYKLSSKYGDANDIPSWFTLSEENILLQTMNVGFDENGDYITSLLISKNGEQTEQTLKNVYLTTGLLNDEKIYLGVYSENDSKEKLLVIENEVFQTIELSSIMQSITGEIFSLQDKIIVCGNQELEQTGKTVLAIIDDKNNLIESREIGEKLSLIYPHKDNLCLVTTTGKIHLYDTNLVLLEEIEPKSQQLTQDLAKYDFYDILIDDEEIVSIMFVAPDGKNKLGFIREYRKSDLSVVNTFDLVYDGGFPVELAQFIYKK